MPHRSLMQVPAGPRCGGEFEITVNAKRVEAAPPPLHTTLLDWLRHSGWTGPKQGCAEGDCGACTVVLVERDEAGRPVPRAVNSCIALAAQFAGREILTVDGLADGDALHPVQEAMVRHYGSQCGFCTPGFVMSMVEGCARADRTEAAAVSDQLCGNLCRCTGYRPIRDAAVEVFGREAAPLPVAARRERAGGASFETAGGGRFLRPTDLGGVFEALEADPAATLVAGATEIGVDVTKKLRRFGTLVALDGVAELKGCARGADGWRLGAGATLVEVEEALRGEFPAADAMLRVFASRQIRNRATLGGNLATASPIGDSAPVLIALGASVELVSPRGTRTVPLRQFFVGYRKTALEPGELIAAVNLPHAPATGRRLARFFKVSKRREMDISIVSAAFCIDFGDGGEILRASMAFGGVAPTPATCAEAEAFLAGKRLDAATVHAAAEILRRPFSPISDARGSADYRAALVVSLWEKFCAGDSGEAADLPLGFTSGGGVWPVADASRAGPHESAAGHVTGRARYVDDLGLARGALTMWPVTAPHARARIVSLDVSAAERQPGVRAVLAARDVPGKNDVGCSREDEVLLADTEVYFHGQVVAVVVGDTEDACREAARLVDARYEALEPILSLDAAIAAGSFHTDANTMGRGEPDAALASAPRRINGRFAFGGQEHFYLETHAAWAEVSADGCVHVCSSTQHPSEIQIIVAKVLGVPRNQVVVEAPRMGGGFGGKETQGNAWAALAALAALKTGRPVRVSLDRDLDMALTGKRHPFLAEYDVGFDDDGMLLAAKIDLVSDGGWSLDLSMPVTDRALFHLDNAYYIPASRFTGRVAKTNVASNTAFRGFGGPQGMLVIEEILARVARETGIAPEAVRERNLYRGSGETNSTHYGQEIGDGRIREIWGALVDQADFAGRRAEIDAWNAAHPKIKRGLAITPVKFGISFTFTPYNQAGALVLVYADGSVQVNHGGTEMGQGLHTKLLGIAMRELGLPAERIRMMFTRTDKVPNTSATAASSGSDLNGAAVADACRQIRERLRPVAAEMLGGDAGGGFVLAGGEAWFEAAPDNRVAFGDLCRAAYLRRVSLAASGFYRTPQIHWDRASGKGRPFYYFACGAAVSEVEVDGWTGMSKVRRVDILHDVGDSLNPGIDRGQIEGGFVQGMGWLTREELVWGADGRLLTHGASTYAIPAIGDAPSDFRVQLLPRATQDGVIGGSKAVGEPPLMLAISVREAIRDAVAAFGPPGGPADLASPATGEAIFRAIQDREARENDG